MGEESKDLEMDLFSSEMELNFDLLESSDEIVEDIKDDESNKDSEDNNEDNKNKEIDSKDKETKEDNKDVNNLGENNDSDNKESSSESVAKEDGESREGESSDKSSPNLFKSVATLLNEEGVFPSLDETKEINTAEDFVKVFNSEIETKVKDTLISKLGEKGYKALESGLSVEQLSDYNADKKVLESIDEDSIKENVELAKQLVYQDYINQGLKQEVASKLLSRLVETGEESLISDAIESLENIKEFNEAQFLEKQRIENEKILKEEKDKEILNQKLKDSIYNFESFIEGEKINPSLKDRVFETMTKVVSRDTKGNPENKLMKHRRENSVEFDTKLYYLYEISNGFKDFSKLVSSTKSKTIKDLEKVIRNNSFSQYNDSSPDYQIDKDSYEGFKGDELNI